MLKIETRTEINMLHRVALITTMSSQAAENCLTMEVFSACNKMTKNYERYADAQVQSYEKWRTLCIMHITCNTHLHPLLFKGRNCV